MTDYSVKCGTAAKGNEVEFHFTAGSFDGALSMAKRRMDGDWAVLLQEGKPLCRMQLVSDTGAWLIGRPSPQD